MDPKLFKTFWESLGSLDDVRDTAKKYYPKITYETLMSIFLQKYQYRIRKKKPNVRSCVRRYLNGEDIISIAVSERFSPYILARFVVENYLRSSMDDTKDSISSKFLRKEITAYIRNPVKIEDERLRAEVQRCIEADLHCSPFKDNIRKLYLL
mmetsp:Transcript_15038/g.27076  ORF Transcript_15038/g.27076 Transcript_15038/m.27076 type:complete len:153 (-) Transcript_15038:696-1154(-)